MLDPQVIGALACAMFAGWQIGEMLRPALRRVGALPRLPCNAAVALLSGDVNLQPSGPPSLQHPAEYYLDEPARRLPEPRILRQLDAEIQRQGRWLQITQR